MEELGKFEAEFEKWRTEALIDLVEMLDELEEEYRLKSMKYSARSVVANTVLARRAMAAAADEKEET